MKCSECGTEIGQKNICPICSKGVSCQQENVQPVDNDADQYPVVIRKSNEGTELQLSEKNNIPLDESVRIKFQRFLDQNCYDWEVAFEKEFSNADFGFYARAYEASKSLWEVRNFLLSAIRATDAKRIIPKFMIQTMTALQGKFPEYPVEAARQWLTELFQHEVERTAAFEKFARTFKCCDPEDLGTMVYISPAKASEKEENAEVGGQVSLAYPVWVQARCVTNSAWKEIMLEGGKDNKYHPNITWDDAMAFCKRLTACCRIKKSIPEGYAYTLPDITLYQFIAQRCPGHLENYSGYEWLWNDEDGSQEKPDASLAGRSDVNFNNLHRETREDNLFFRVVLAPVRPGCIWDEVEIITSSSGSSGVGISLV